MPAFMVMEPGQPDRAFQVTTDNLLIGRANDVDLRLPDKSVSRKHARLVRDGVIYELTDLYSQNGILVNGKRIKKRTLRRGDEILIGKFKMVWWEQPAGVDLGETDTMEILPPYVAESDIDADNRTQRLSPDNLRQIVLAHRLRKAAKLLPLDKKRDPIALGEGSFTVGPNADIHAMVSFAWKAVARIEWTGKAHVIRKTWVLASVRVNGDAVRVRTLRPGDQIQVGETKFKYVVGKKKTRQSPRSVSP